MVAPPLPTPHITCQSDAPCHPPSPCHPHTRPAYPPHPATATHTAPAAKPSPHTASMRSSGLQTPHNLAPWPPSHSTSNSSSRTCTLLLRFTPPNPATPPTLSPGAPHAALSAAAAGLVPPVRGHGLHQGGGGTQAPHQQRDRGTGCQRSGHCHTGQWSFRALSGQGGAGQG